jgi:hypothetical protein
MKLSQLQQEFSRCVGLLLCWIYAQPGYGVTGGEWHRPKEMSKLYAERGLGIDPSVHNSRLAVDLNLFINGEYRPDTAAYKEAGEFWESLNPLARWGGRFNDGGHFSFEHEGRK